MKKVGKMLLALIILAFNIIIGANEKEFRILTITIFLTIIMIYLGIIKYKNKNSSIVFKNKVDVLVFIFIISTTLPLLFKTYASYSDTIEFIIKYFFIYSVYLLARNAITEEKEIEEIITVTLISSLIPIIIGLDYIHGEHLKQIMKSLNLLYNKREEFDATFGYANTVAIYMSFCIFLAIHKIRNNDKKIIKIMCYFYIVFSIYIIYLTKSKWVWLALFVTLSVLILLKYKKYILKNRVKVLSVSVGVLAILIPTIIYGLNVPQEIVKRGEDYNDIIKYRFKENSNYELELDLETESNTNSEENDEDAYEIYVLEGGEYFTEKNIANKKIGYIKDTIKIEFTTTKNTNYIRLIIVNRYNGNIKISNCKLNGKEYILKYKYIPNEVSYVFSGFLINGQSIKQREYIYRDCLKIAKQNPIIGKGGNTWKCMSTSVADYPYVLKETHSYFFELLICYGIVGTVCFLTFVILTYINIIKECLNKKKNKKVLIAIGLLLILLHSITFDFDMSFMLIQIIVYSYIAILNYDNHETMGVSLKYLDYVVMLLITIILSICIRASVAQYLIKDSLNKHKILPYKKEYYIESIKNSIENNEEIRKIINELKEFMDKEPYYYQTETYTLYFDLLNRNLDDLSNNEVKDYLNYGIDNLKNTEFISPMQFNSVIERARFFSSEINRLNTYTSDESINKRIGENKEQDTDKIDIIKKAVEELKIIFNEEYKENLININAKERNGCTSEQIYSILIIYNTIVKQVNNN